MCHSISKKAMVKRTDFSSSANYAINDHHSLGVNVAVNKNTSSSISSIYSLNEQQINFTYGYLF